MKKVKIKDEIIEVPGYFEIKNNHLFNSNTKRYEGVDGDIVIITRNGISEKGHIKGYTEYQIIPTYEWPTRIVSANGIHDGTTKIEFIHQTPVYEL